MFGIHRNFPAGGGGSTADATAEQWHIKNGKTAYIAAGKVTGSAYTPAMMEFDGSSGTYTASYTSSGNAYTTLVRFSIASFTGDDYQCALAQFKTNYTLIVRAYSSDYTSDANRADTIECQVLNTAGTVICRLYTSSAVLDGSPHTLFFSFDGTAGTAVLYVDGSDADDTGNASRVAPTTGTLNSGTTTAVRVGSLDGSIKLWSGELGFVGLDNSYLTNHSSFMQSDGSPIYQDPATSWSGSGFGSQPLFFNPHGDMVNNLGSAGAMTKSGTIYVGDGGAT